MMQFGAHALISLEKARRRTIRELELRERDEERRRRRRRADKEKPYPELNLIPTRSSGGQGNVLGGMVEDAGAVGLGVRFEEEE